MNMNKSTIVRSSCSGNRQEERALIPSKNFTERKVKNMKKK